jgi:hypothetical protein
MGKPASVRARASESAPLDPGIGVGQALTAWFVAQVAASQTATTRPTPPAMYFLSLRELNASVAVKT